ncbi:MAG: class I SAM-dependent RNA methyltransferase [Acidobacteria bacterium]|nr:class I SAM-dependent RNA methyltransferase [Acidobacteriota bacterium]
MAIEIEIEKLVHGGMGLGRIDGRVALVPYVLPGELVEIEPVRETKSLIRGQVIKRLRASDARIASLCPVFEVCGGCHFQHIPYEEQLEHKRGILLETLSRMGKVKWEGPVEVIAGEPWGYRNRTQLRVKKLGREVSVGFLEAGSHNLVNVESCPINSPSLNKALAALIAMGKERRFPEALGEIEFFTNETDVQVNVIQTEKPLSKVFFTWCEQAIEGFSQANSLDVAVGEWLFRVGSRSFFQVNRFLLEPMLRETTAGAAGKLALDLYSGVGLFTLPLAKQFEEVVAVDTSRPAMIDLRFNLKRAGLNARVVNLPVADYLASLEAPPDFVVADPPRAGLTAVVTEQLLRLAPKELVLVSCDPATLARDLAALTTGGYAIESIKMLDLFPQTFHMEAIVKLSR